MSNESIQQKDKNAFNRRNFLKTGAIGSALLGTGVLLPACTSSTTKADNRSDLKSSKAKNVIILVSDGMSMGTLAMADHFIKQKENRASHWIDLYEKGKLKRSLMDMASANSLVTDSAAAGSSWGCGYRVNNGSINIGTENQTLKPINKWFKEAGKSAGCVTTTRITHATPASFAIAIHERWLEDKIAEKYLEEEYDIMLGGGIEHFLSDKREDGRDMIAEFKNKGFHFVQTKDEMNQLPSDDKPIMGAFTTSHLPYSLDHINDNDLLKKVPTLAELTETAIEKLSKNKNGFILQVEGGRVDHAAHSNDIGGLIYDQVALDDAIKVAVDFAEKDRETLVIVTTDHGNASPSLTGSGRSYSQSTEDFKKFHNFKRSNTALMEELKKDNSSAFVKKLISDATGIKLDSKEIEIIQKATYESFYQDVVRNQRSLIIALSDVIGKHLAVTWANTHHTSDFTELSAMGPGSERLGGFVRNTELFQLMTSAAGVETNVPSFAEAAR